MTTLEIMKKAKAAAPFMRTVTTEQKNAALLAIADAVTAQSPAILAENAKDVEAAEGVISPTMIDRLLLNEKRIQDIADSIRCVAELDDPVGKVLSRTVHKNGLIIEKTAVPMGVIAIIYESRPNVTADAAVLSIKSGNACILRSGKEAWRSASAITDAMRSGLVSAGFPADVVQLVEDTSRESALELMTGVGYIDLLIPRGSAGLIKTCVETAKVPCIETGTGICHIYIDESADMDMAVKIVDNAKTSRPSVCNAAEVCLINKKIAPEILPKLYDALVTSRTERGLTPVEIRAGDDVRAYIPASPAGELDFDTEFLDYIMAFKIVSDVNEAIDHIAAHSTGHSEAIVTENNDNASLFTSMVDSAAVYVNASTRFTDGGEYGLGCEMGISTQKLHARGPMGLSELTTYKYIVHGDGQIR